MTPPVQELEVVGVSDLYEAVLGTSVATLLMHPVDIARTRIAVQNETWRLRGQFKVLYRGNLQALLLIRRYDGFLSLYKGIVPGLLYCQVTHGVRLGLFQFFEDLGLTLDENLEPSVNLSFISGAVCGAVGSFLGSPLNLAKCKLQIRSSPVIAVGHQHGYTNTLGCLSGVYHSHGLRRGLWRAATGNIIRVAMGSGVQMASFVQFKRMATSTGSEGTDELFAVVVASLASSAASAPFSSALDMIKTRMYLQPVDRRGRGIYYSGFIDCILKVYRNDGLRSYMRGWSVAFTYTLFNSLITLISWEELKRFGSHAKSTTDRYMTDIYYRK
ncbi:solute carrier family 25 member 35-like [Ornithodoros turicata]|uniref:solute carrier family 25 member 35-like n=1 Tax=Ornithodoros turicata TaxID=34597 RepID=UPI003138F6A8